MPAVGKSTVGVLLAKMNAMAFVDTDLIIQEHERMSLQDVLSKNGPDGLKRIEEHCILSIDQRNAVIATGGSVVYSSTAMQHLKEDGVIVYLQAPLDVIQQRLVNLDSRGVLKRPGQNLEDLYAERMPLYEKYADYIVNAGSGTHETVALDVLTLLAVHPWAPPS